MKYIITMAICALLSFTWNGERMTPQSNNQRENALKAFCGKFSIVAPGAMKEGVTWDYDMELDPVRSSCTWIETGFVDIRNSKGWCGTLMQGAEAWEVYRFSLHNNLKHAIAEMRRVDSMYEGENRLCKVKLVLDGYGNIKMSYIKGNDAPAPLCDSRGGFKQTATFYREL